MTAGVGPTVGWLLPALSVVVGYWVYGWPGVLLALTVVAFWLLLQFSQALRLMKAAAQRPVGSTRSAVMLHSKLKTGLRLADVMKLTGSFGKPVASNAAAGSTSDADVETTIENYSWADDGDDAVQVTLVGGRVTRWALQRAAEAPPPGA